MEMTSDKPVQNFDIKLADASWLALKHQASKFNVEEIANVVLDDPRFKIWSGSSKPMQHHYGKHGLVIHTAEVCKLCYLNNDVLNAGIHGKLLILAAIFHDAGKMWDYKPTCQSISAGSSEIDYHSWSGTRHKRNIHHISRSALVWQDAVRLRKDISDEDKDEVLHAILAHHGQREWGSPVGPNTKLAWMLHLCDGISARMQDAERWDQHSEKK